MKEQIFGEDSIKLLRDYEGFSSSQYDINYNTYCYEFLKLYILSKAMISMLVMYA